MGIRDHPVSEVAPANPYAERLIGTLRHARTGSTKDALHCPYHVRGPRIEIARAPVAGPTACSPRRHHRRRDLPRPNRHHVTLEGIGISLPHAKAGRGASGTSSAIRCSSRTNYRHQHFIFAARNRFVASCNTQSDDARRTGRSYFTFRSSRTRWAWLTRITFWSGRSGGSLLALRSRLTLRPLRARARNEKQAQQRDSQRCRSPHYSLPIF